MKFVAAISLLVALSSAALAAEPQVIDPNAQFPEGPIYLDGKLTYAQYGASKISVWDGSAVKTLYEQPGCGANALYPLGDDLIVACYDGNSLSVISRDGKLVKSYDKASNGDTIQGPNDIASDGKGGVYVTASGPWETAPIVGKVFHVTADGTITEVANDIHYANGVTLTPDGKRLLVAESEAGRVISFAVGADGSLTDRRLFVRVGKVDEKSGIDAYPDGIKLGPDGNLYIGQYSSGRIVVVDMEGKLMKVYEVPSTAAPNLAFSPDGKTMAVTAVDDKSGAPYPGKVYLYTVN